MLFFYIYPVISIWSLGQCPETDQSGLLVVIREGEEVSTSWTVPSILILAESTTSTNIGLVAAINTPGTAGHNSVRAFLEPV